jgi:flagellum-specific peptidoglycan hydrolase FlgJ
MKEWGIPASITLAQGILESRWGTSELATKANNHFGIKVGGADWKGGKYCKYSNEWNAKKNRMELHLSCFRYYENVQEGYRGHSEFLAKRPRYAPLFRLAPNDYVSWSKELQACGYATDPKYPEKLISLIERFNLYEHDGHRSIQVLDQFWNGQNVKLPR